ncbi:MULTISPECIES: DUF2157 domain-containing protein [Pseudomonadati]|uniref:DUF2157 domain-containing protein n=1 Tax=Shewanella aestuarii TaxID=1028752 RepID=A0ABT0L2R1_9GAMM|nr:DUF2157 domain-containing protein [Shewanella aestuarii]MCL1117526.1 DUF2157 domain-containing protein [Shewanella aestuarii]GGN75524.1 hypothetical protein GCM10009193_15860 [Shewanella aestuarii]
MMIRKRSDIWHWFTEGKIAANKLNAAMLVAYPHPTQHNWLQLITHLVLFLGILLLSAGVIFFMAFNWDALANLTKFAIVEGLLIAFICGFYAANRASNTSIPFEFSPLNAAWNLANAMLLGASIMVGALLALVGQTYQTGADPWQLFALWAVLILPFAVIAGFDLLWLLVVVLINISLGIYFDSFSHVFGLLLEDIQILAIFGLINLTIHVLFSLARRLTWTAQARFHCPAVEATSILAGVVCLTWLMIWVVFDFDSTAHFGFYTLAYVTLMATMFGWYRYRSPALYPLTLVLTSLCAVIVALLSRGLLENNDPVGIFLLIAMIIVGLTSGCLYWLKQIQQEFTTKASLNDGDANHE